MRLHPWIVVLSLVGCKASHPGVDLGSTPDGGNTPGLTAVASCTEGLVGLRISCDGQQSSDAAGRALTFAWSVTGTPDKSTDSSTGSGSSFSFAPKIGGTYEVTLVVSNSDGGSSIAKAGALADTVPLFYRQSTITKSSDSFAVGIVNSDGTGAHLLSCPVMIADPSNGDAGAGNRGTYADTPGAVGTRVWYRPNNLPAVVAFENVTASEHQLLVNNEDGDCSSRPAVRLDATPAAQHLMPRFSPSGARVAWIDVASPGSLQTAALDGSDRRVVRTAAKLKNAPPVWVDETHLSWVEDASADMTPHLQIASAVDAAGAGDSARSTLLDCNPAADPSALTVINQFERSASGLVVAGGLKSRTANPPGATLLYRMAASGCSTTAATVLADEPGGSYAWDFALSPDGVTLVYSAVEGPGAGAQDLWLVSIDGSVPPSRFVGSAPGVNDIGPVWIADGKQISWTQVAADGSAHGGGLMVANRDGTGVRSVLTQGGSSAADIYVVGATNRGLDCSAAGTGVAVGDALLLLGAVFFFRRRRRA
ncbi:MAG: hypothetical protein JWN44_1827 [Myxococcales bacterium]|nr:hypothetical protein [Myxococcales bacterium]